MGLSVLWQSGVCERLYRSNDDRPPKRQNDCAVEFPPEMGFAMAYCFYAMEAIKPQNTDGIVLRNRHNRQKRPAGRYLRAKCGQNYNQVANGLIVWNQPSTSR
jgi:hypothetical protein